MWFIIGILVGGLAVFTWQRLNLEGRKPAWYAWALLLVGLADLLITVEAVWGSIVESEPTAAVRFVIIGGLVLVLAWGFAWRTITSKPKAVKAGKAA